MLSYDAKSKSFTGTVENVSGAVAENVRVEVHLSNGTELGPTTPINLKPRQKLYVARSAIGEAFDKWSAHAEVGSGEENHSGESRNEHGGGSHS